MSQAGGEVVLVSGGSRGLGLSIVRALLEDGCTVATFSRRTTQELQDLADGAADRLLVREGDAADRSFLASLVSGVETEVGPVTGLVNNSGVAPANVLALQRAEEIEQVVAVNLTATLELTRLVVRRMNQRRRGSIVSISSIVGMRGYRGLVAYSATKAALDGMTRALARELGQRGIRVNSIAPGFIDTDMTSELGPVQREQIVRRTPLGRLGRPEDVVACLRFLLSPSAGFITGQTLVVDGGITC